MFFHNVNDKHLRHIHSFYKSEAAVCRRSSEQVFVNILQYLQKNNCVGVSFNEVIKKNSCTGEYPVNISKFLRTPFLQSTSDGCF